MSERKVRLTPELGQQIVAAIRAGGYPHVAAEAFGVPKDDFDDWLKRGNTKNAWDPYRTFARDVRQAFAQARLRAEMAGYEKDPKAWLIHGPGRESEQQPGWSVSVKPAETHTEARNILLDPELMALFRALMEILQPFPEARSEVAKVLTNMGALSK
jgi:hypothetical protein